MNEKYTKIRTNVTKRLTFYSFSDINVTTINEYTGILIKFLLKGEKIVDKH